MDIGHRHADPAGAWSADPTYAICPDGDMHIGLTFNAVVAIYTPPLFSIAS